MTEGKYIITDGKRFIYQNYNGRIKTSTSYAQAMRFSSIQEGFSFLKDMLPYHLKREFYVGSYNGDKLIEHKRMHTQGEATIKKDISDKKGYQLNGCINGLEEWFNAIQSLKWIIDRIEKNDKELYNEISRIDLILADLRHSYLRQDINACRRCKRDVVVQEYERKRQQLKNEAQLMEVCSLLDRQSIRDIIETANKIQSKIYKPRQVDELYENGIDEIYKNIKKGVL